MGGWWLNPSCAEQAGEAKAEEQGGAEAQPSAFASGASSLTTGGTAQSVVPTWMLKLTRLTKEADSAIVPGVPNLATERSATIESAAHQAILPDAAELAKPTIPEEGEGGPALMRVKYDHSGLPAAEAPDGGISPDRLHSGLTSLVLEGISAPARDPQRIDHSTPDGNPQGHWSQHSLFVMTASGQPSTLAGIERNNATAPRPSLMGQVAAAIGSHAARTPAGSHTDLTLRLEPPELGPLRIHLRASEHSLEARVVVEVESTRQLLVAQVESLRQRLHDMGLTLGQFDVSSERRNQGREAPVVPTERGFSAATAPVKAVDTDHPAPGVRLDRVNLVM